MKKRAVPIGIAGLAVLALAGALTPRAFGSVSVVETSVLSISGPQVTLLVHNPTDHQATARIRIPVLLYTDAEQVLTSSAVTVPSGGTVFVTLIATASVTSPTEDPEPFPPI